MTDVMNMILVGSEMSLTYKNLSVINPFPEICIALKLTINFSEKVIYFLWLELIQVKVLSQKQTPKQNLFHVADFHNRNYLMQLCK